MAANKFVIVQTEYGPVKGISKTTALGRNIYDFRAIPYMKAPVGKLRFTDAQSPENWKEPIDATGERPSYFSVNPYTKQADGQEDAGIISIATPYMDRKLPVAVYIHGGGFQMSYGKLDMYGGDYLLQKDILYVNFNYRVGPIGFLSLQDPALNIPGNAGLKDQVFALKWVKKNIENFGGDPDNITIFGTSAGAVSVHLLMMSELGRGLFHKAIPMSGTSFTKAWPFVVKKELTERLATSLGWDGVGGEKGILEVLENASAQDLVEAEYTLLTKEEIYGEHICFPFTPVVEPYVTRKTFLLKDPVLLGREAWSNDVDCMLGGTSCEGAMMLMWIAGVNFSDYLQDPAALTLKRELGLDMTKPSDRQKALEIGEKLKTLYFGENLPSPDSRNQYFRYAGDLHFWHGIYRATLSRIHAGGKGKTYLYHFDLSTSLNIMRAVLQGEYEGASHGDDLAYLFKANFPGFPGPTIVSKEFDFIKQMVSYVTSFIINGNPNDISNSDNWEPVTSSEPLTCFNITNERVETIVLPVLDRLKVWDDICDSCNVPVY